MARKFKIFGREFEWYDVKTKFKKLLRGLFYLGFTQELICYIIIFYMWLVYLTSTKKFVNFEPFTELLRQKRAIILASWHNRLMMTPFVLLSARKKAKLKYNMMTLVSRHGDGRFVGIVMEKFGFKNMYGSSQDSRKSTRGIDLATMRSLIRGLKNGHGLGITPDGPRGPNQKINGEIVNIAKISGAVIVPISYSTSRMIELNSWDKFKIPLPFSKLTFYCGEFFEIDKNLPKEDEEKMRLRLENAMNFAQEESRKF